MKGRPPKNTPKPDKSKKIIETTRLRNLERTV
jgi:hypothetical protein